MKSVIVTEIATSVTGAETSFSFPSTGNVVMLKTLLTGHRYKIVYFDIIAAVAANTLITPQLYTPSGTMGYFNFPNYIAVVGTSNEVVDKTENIPFVIQQSASSTFWNIATSALTLTDAFVCTMIIEVID